jgi:beta-galactosidase
MNRIASLSFIIIAGINLTSAEAAGHTFALGQQDFLLDGKPFQIISGELIPVRIPREYWQHRIQMVKAMGCNTIAAYLFWNYYV